MAGSGAELPPARPRGAPRIVAALCALVALSLAFPPARAETPWPETPVLQSVFPDADGFGGLQGEPPAAPAYRKGALVGYLFRSRLVSASSGYGGKPLDVLVGLGLDGRIRGARLLEHSEPILLIGVSDEDLDVFVESYEGLDVRRPVRVTRARRPGPDEITAVAGATVSSAVINDAIVQSARAVARSRGIIGGEGGGEGGAVDLDRFETAGWPALLDSGAIARLRLDVASVAERFARQGVPLYPPGAAPPDPQATFIDLYAALATPAQVGRNLLGERSYARLLAGLADGDQLVFVAARGLYSFKGTNFVRSGRFERLQLVQGERSFRFAAAQYRRPNEIAIENAPALRETALFVLPQDSDFDPRRPWRLELLVRRDGPEGPALASFALPYRLPDALVRAQTARQDRPRPLWQERWEARRLDLTVLGAALALLTVLLVLQDLVARRPRLYRYLRLGFLAFTVAWLGWYAAAQLSVLNVLTFTEALRTAFVWDFFLLEPLLFVLWSYVAIVLVFWGRGVFCGWLCPFGAMQELTGRLARGLRLPRLALPHGVNERLWPVKYIAFIGLFALSLGSLLAAQRWAEVEPFKTAVVLKFARDWPYVAYAAGLLLIAAFVERPFCRYLCPLGAALALPARLRLFEWLKRRPQCGTECHICAQRCPVQAIHPQGQINPNECIYCLECQVVMYDEHTCPPMIRRRKRRELQRRQG